MMRRIKKKLVWSAFLIFLTAIFSEIVAKYYFGLGTPPLVIKHPKIEYMFKPNQDVFRFGNHFTTNQYGMRSKPFDIKKGSSEFRVMVFGDSVLNGGNLTDQKLLSTTVLENKINTDKIKKIVVGNISAGSWGPGNWLAYAKNYGFFGADVVVLVLSSHDYADNPTFEILNPNTHPTEAPISALLEGVTRYLPRYLPVLDLDNKNKTELDKFIAGADEKEVRKGLGDLTSFLELAKRNSPQVLVMQHWERLEVERGSTNPGNQRIKGICEKMEISCVSLEPYFSRSMKIGVNPYRDNIHPNQIGQKLIAEAIFENMTKQAL
jgi:hypothetical protein